MNSKALTALVAGGTQRAGGGQSGAGRGAALAWLLPGLTAALVACAPGEISGENALPVGTTDPASVQTPGGALAFYHKVVASVPFSLDTVVVLGGILTDELVDLPLPLFSGATYTGLDSRTDLGSYSASPYNSLHHLRAQAREARGFAATYLDSLPAVRGHLYALEGYAEVFLADLFCSGIPLSTVDYGADYTLAAGSTTSEVYRHAVTLFDTALTLLGDSVDLQHLAALGRGRALLALERYAEAAASVAAVPDGYRYAPPFVEANAGGELLHQFAALVSSTFGYGDGLPSVADREGVFGLDYRSSNDPRVPWVILGPDRYHNDLYFPAKYPTDGPATFPLAEGPEARLIEAEAALNAGSDAWLAILNALRTDGTYDTQPNANDPNQTDTLWHAGTGGVPGLAPLPDPGSADARVDLLFRERAFWLYLTGHRQGDLRRLIRQYGRAPTAVYPTGPYAGGSGAYGTAVVFPVPASEADLNPKYTGCFHTNA